MYKIKELRENKGWTQEYLSNKAGISRSLLSNLETDGNTVTTTNTLIKIAAALDCKVSDIFLP